MLKTENSEICGLLPWDSGFFGIRIARVRKNRVDPDLMSNIITWCQLNEVECLYFLADSNHTETLRLAENHGFHFMDIRVMLHRDLNFWEPIQLQRQKVSIRPWQAEDIPRLQKIAANSFTMTRFYRDHCFSLSACSALYQTWIKNSCEGFADIVLVAENGNQPIGFITGHINRRENTVSIGLLAVEENNRGIGAGKLLIENLLDWCTNQTVHNVSVVTQGSNIPSLGLYQKYNFIISSVHIWYHKWFIDCSSEKLDKLSNI